LATSQRWSGKARTDTNIKRARAAGIFGRPNALNKHQQEEALKLLGRQVAD
jgi:hypothetical protein